MKKTVFLLSTSVILLFSVISCSVGKGGELKVLQLNLWAGASQVPGGAEALPDIIAQTGPDIVLLCETLSAGDTSLVSNTLKTLSDRGMDYYPAGAASGVRLLSKYRPLSQEWTCVVPGNEERAILRVIISVRGREYAIYSAHIDHRNYACYQPRGYDGSSWKKMDAVVTDEDEILRVNRLSYRDESVAAFLKEAAKDIEAGRSVIIGGDFNEPSHLDWGESTAQLWDHNGAVVRWDCSTMLETAGFKDAFRVCHPEPVAVPGFTYPAGNEAAARASGVRSLTWAPEADERDRIDFIYYFPSDPSFAARQSWTVGPAAMVIRSEIVPDSDESWLVTPEATWPSDHRGNLTVFSLP